MRIYINGMETEAAERLTVAALVDGKGLNPDTVVVEHNRIILPKEKWSQIVLTADDELEIITFVGGG